MQRAKQVNTQKVAIGPFCVLMAMWVALYSSERASAAEPTWRPAPVLIGINSFGYVDYRLGYRKTQSTHYANQGTSLVVGVNVRATSFFWQPWFARIETGVKAAIGYGIYDGGREVWRMHRTANSLNRTVSGSVGLNLVPRSRFPFRISFERLDMRSEFGSNGPGGDAGSVTDTFNVAQQYGSRSGEFTWTANYGTSQSEFRGVRVNDSRFANLDVSLHPSAKQTLIINVNKNLVQRNRENNWNNRMVSRHTYSPDSALSVATLASKIKIENIIVGRDTSHEVVQFNSSGTLRPSDTRLTAVGGLYSYDSTQKSSGFNYFDTSNSTSYTGANLGANFAWNQWIRLYGSASVFDQTGVQSVTSTSLSNLSIALALRHGAKPVKLGIFKYTRSAALTLSNSASNQSAVNQSNSSSTSGSAQSISSQLNQGLNYATPLGAGNVSLNISQWLTSSSSRSSSNPEISTPTLQANQTASLAWTKNRSSVRLYGSTLRNMRGEKPYFQSLNLQSSQSEGMGQNSSISGNLTVNASRQGYEAAELPSPEVDSVTSSASLNYYNMRAFNVRDMKLISTLQLISPELLRREQQAWNQGKYKWDTTLTKIIAKLTAELRLTLEDVQSSKQLWLFFNARREF